MVGSAEDNAFLSGSEVSRLFIGDFRNQFSNARNNDLRSYLQRNPVNQGTGSIQIEGRVGIADILNFYFSTPYATGSIFGLNDELRRFSNIIQVTGGVYQLPQDQAAREEEAKGLIRVYQDFLKSKQSQLNALGNNFSRLNSTVLEPARVALIGQYVQEPGLGISINGDVIAGEDQTSLARNTKHITDTDVLTGSNQSDLILAESGNDVLEGGQGNDVLYGGTGTDVYVHRAGDGNDIIVDADGNGVVRQLAGGDGSILSVGLRAATDPPGVYRSPDGSITYTWSGIPGDDLTITTLSGAVLTVKNYQPGHLHLRLFAQPADALGLTLSGNDGNNTSAYAQGAAWSNVRGNDLRLYANGSYDGLGNQTNDAAQGDLVASFLTATILGGAGADALIGNGRSGLTLFAGAGHDILLTDVPAAPSVSGPGARLYGDTGNDILYGGAGDDFLDGGPDHDFIAADQGRDWITGGGGNDWLQGYGDDDALDGGTGSDYLFGGLGADVLLGGLEADHLYGDANAGNAFWDRPTGQLRLLSGTLLSGPTDTGIYPVIADVQRRPRRGRRSLGESG